MRTNLLAVQVGLVWLAMAAFEALVLPSLAAAAAIDDFVPPDDEALVVFIQNLREDRGMSFLVFEADGTCIGRIGGREARAVPMKPGAHRIYVSGYRTERIELELEAARTYFVRLYTVQRTMARKSEVTLVRRGTSSYMELRTWLDGATVTHASQDHCWGKPLRERKRQSSRRIVEGDAEWSDGGAQYQQEHTLGPDEGFTAEELEAMTEAVPESEHE